MLIRVKIGNVEIEYSEPTSETNYPKCTSQDKFEGTGTNRDALIKTIEYMADKAAQIYRGAEI